MIEQYPKLSFPFEADFIPKNGRKTRSGLFMGSDVAEIREAGPGEARTAFRIHYHPTLDSEPLDILALDDRCWWPLGAIPNRDRPGLEDHSRSALLNEIATCEFDILGMIPQGADRPSPVEETDLRSFDPSRRGAALARARSKIRRNILVYEDRSYALGGEPVYLAGERYASGGNGAVSAGADRSVHPTFAGLRYPPGNFTSAEVQHELRKGNFFAADDNERLEAETNEHGQRHAAVEVLAPEMVRMCGPQLRLDALFRLVVKLRDDCRRHSTTRFESGRDVSCRLKLQTLPLPDDSVTRLGDSAMTRARLRALDVVQDILEEWSVFRFGTEYIDLRREISLFKQKEAAFIVERFRDELTAEEDKALQSLPF